MKHICVVLLAGIVMISTGCQSPAPVLPVPQPPPFSTIFQDAMMSLAEQLTLDLPAGATQRVVVADFRATDRIAQEHVTLIRGRLNALLPRYGSLLVIEDSSMILVLTEIGKQYDFAERGIMDDNQIAQLRGKIPAEYAITGEIIETRRELEVHARMVALNTGHIVSSANVTIPIGILPRDDGFLYPGQALSVIEPGIGWLRVKMGGYRRDTHGRLICTLVFFNDTDHPASLSMVEPERRTYLAMADGRAYGCETTEPRMRHGITVPSRSSVTVRIWMSLPGNTNQPGTLFTEWMASGASIMGARQFRMAVPTVRNIPHA